MAKHDDKHIKQLMHSALDEAFMAHICTLYKVWVTDPTGQPQRAAKGTRIALDVYKQAFAAIENLEV